MAYGIAARSNCVRRSAVSGAAQVGHTANRPLTLTPHRLLTALDGCSKILFGSKQADGSHFVWTSLGYAYTVIAELGIDMSRFPTLGHAGSWAGLAPGKNDSAGRNHSARTFKANRYLCTALVEAAYAAGRTSTNLGEKYRRLARHRGKKRAAVAAARTLLTIIYHMIRQDTEYIERGATYFDQLHPQSTQQWLIRRPERFGFQVMLEALPMAA